MYTHKNLGAKIYIFFDICKSFARKSPPFVIIVNFYTDYVRRVNFSTLQFGAEEEVEVRTRGDL